MAKSETSKILTPDSIPETWNPCIKFTLDWNIAQKEDWATAIAACRSVVTTKAFQQDVTWTIAFVEPVPPAETYSISIKANERPNALFHFIFNLRNSDVYRRSVQYSRTSIADDLKLLRECSVEWPCNRELQSSLDKPRYQDMAIEVVLIARAASYKNHPLICARNRLDLLSDTTNHLSDFTVLTGLETLRVHRMVLADHSSVFSKMFETDMKEKRTGEVTIDHHASATVVKMIQHMYCKSTVEGASLADLLSLYSACNEYDYKELRSLCNAGIQRRMSTANIISILQFVDGGMGARNGLKRAAHLFFGRNVDIISHSDDWELLRFENPILAHNLLRNAASQAVKVLRKHRLLNDYGSAT
ncbi:hypothetical protein BV898_10670 [Hypsibius exemplaris]|uniref:BTB domain-containing protein n=1 Tax=Hypsibius exemplaris TaxID=2072580 RepID=A0A1W0WIY5_HYPEX|nr:hypothetical protein BV898_10670 [Hypsibius exemplaris]